MTMRYSKKVAQRVIEGQAFALDTKAGRLHSFNASGSLIWELAGRGLKENEIARAVVDDFEVGYGDAAADVRKFLARLKAMGLVEGK